MIDFQKYWFIFPIIITGLIIIGGYNLEQILSSETTTTLTTPNLGTQCNVITQKLIGFDVNGSVICATDQTGNIQASNNTQVITQILTSNNSVIGSFDYSIYQKNGFDIGIDNQGKVLFNQTSPTNDGLVLQSMLNLAGQKQGTIQVSGVYQLNNINLILPDKVSIIGLTLGNNQNSRVPNFVFTSTGGFTLGTADKVISLAVICNDPSSIPCLTITGNVNYLDQVRVNGKARDVAVQFGKGYSFGATNSNFINSITISGGKIGLHMYNNTQNYFGNVLMTSYTQKGVYFEGSDHNHFVNLFLSSPGDSGPSVTDIEFGNGKYDLTLANQIDTLTTPPLDTTIKINTASYGSVRPNFIHVLGIDNSPNYVYTNGGYSDVVIDHTTIPYYQGFGSKYTPSLPTNIGSTYSIINTNPYTVKIYQNGGTGVNIGTFTGGNFIPGGYTNIGNQNYFELLPGEKVYFAGTKPTSWVWYANN